MENDKEMFVKRELLNVQKCGIIGCGAVGATTAHTLLGSGLFSEIVLIDVNRKKAEGEAMDIGHGAPFVKPVNIYAGDYSDLRDAYLVIITAGANQMPGETRIDLAEKNVKIFQSIIPQITAYNRACILLIVSNPVDILTYVALKLSGFEPGRVIGSGTVLDTGRFKYLLGEHLGVDSRNVHALIIGEHGTARWPCIPAQTFPVWIWMNFAVHAINVQITKVCTAFMKRLKTAPMRSSSARARPFMP